MILTKCKICVRLKTVVCCCCCFFIVYHDFFGTFSFLTTKSGNEGTCAEKHRSDVESCWSCENLEKKKNKSFYYFVENIKVKILGIWEKSGKIPDFLW